MGATATGAVVISQGATAGRCSLQAVLARSLSLAIRLSLAEQPHGFTDDFFAVGFLHEIIISEPLGLDGIGYTAMRTVGNVTHSSPASKTSPDKEMR